jgi:hypothetical protein
MVVQEQEQELPIADDDDDLDEENLCVSVWGAYPK